MSKDKSAELCEEVAEIKGAVMALLVLSIRSYAKSENVSFEEAKAKILGIAAEAQNQSIAKFFSDKNSFLNGERH
jgi:hypothetical protein